MRIIGPPSTDLDNVLFNLSVDTNGVHPRFIDQMVNPLWDAAMKYTIDPVGVIAQAYKETGMGNYTGKVKPEFFNTCGLKVRYQNLNFTEYANPQPLLGDQPLAHAMFANWQVGAIAHVQHLRAYAGWPIDDMVIDPRYTYITNKWCENFEDLSGKWAPALDYGQKIVEIARRLQA